VRSSWVLVQVTRSDEARLARLISNEQKLVIGKASQKLAEWVVDGRAVLISNWLHETANFHSAIPF
jgi:hypothetical protein